MSKLLISVERLNNMVKSEDLKIIDVSVSTVAGKEPITYDKLTTIPNSLFLDLFGQLEDKEQEQLHAFPTQAIVQKSLQDLGVTSESTIVLYDNQGIYSSPRAWWVLNAFGVKNLRILDGGLPEWVAKGFPTASHYSQPAPTKQAIKLIEDSSFVVSKQQVFDNLQKPQFTVIDVRKAGRFNGTLPEPREGMRSGHIPNALNLPFSELFDGFTYLPKNKLALQFKQLDLTQESHLVMSCGSGITACIGLVAANIAGYDNLALYDGSWSEWGSDHSLPIE